MLAALSLKQNVTVVKGSNWDIPQFHQDQDAV